MFHRISTLVWKEGIQFARDRLLTTFLFLLPILQLGLLARATGNDITDLRVAILDMDNSPATRQMISDIDNRPQLAVRYFVEDESEIQDLLDWGRVEVGVILPPNLEQDLGNPSRLVEVKVVVNGENSVVGSTAIGAVSAVFNDFGREMLEERGFQTDLPIDLRINTYYNPAYNIRYFTIPAQVGFITYQITLAFSSLGLARERELGTLEQLIVAPLSRLELVLGKTIPSLIIGAFNFVMMSAVAVHLFGVPMRGSFALLFSLTLLFLIAEIGWGILISAVSRTQQQSILFVFIMAMLDMTFSGYLVPTHNLPQVLQVISRAVPMYHYLTIIRGVMVKGAGLATLWPQALALAALALIIPTLTIRGVARRLD